MAPQVALFDTSTIDKLVFRAHRGTRHGFGGGPSDPFVIDDLSLNFAVVPEPASRAPMIAGFGMMGTALRRRRAVATA